MVTAPGEEPVRPPPILCSFCLGHHRPRPAGDLIALGEFLYRRKGCSTCHGAEGRGGIANDNSTGGTVPDHATTTRKLVIASPEDAELVLELLQSASDLDNLSEEPPIDRFGVLRARFDNARKIIQQALLGKARSERPEPPGADPRVSFRVDSSSSRSREALHCPALDQSLIEAARGTKPDARVPRR